MEFVVHLKLTQLCKSNYTPTKTKNKITQKTPKTEVESTGQMGVFFKCQFSDFDGSTDDI